MTVCERMQDELKAYADRELPIARRGRLGLHLLRCAACRQEIHAMEEMSATMRAGTTPLDAALRDRILAEAPDPGSDSSELPSPAAERQPWLRRNALKVWAVGTVGVAAWCIYMGMPQHAFAPDSSTNQSRMQAVMKNAQDYDESGAKTPSTSAGTPMAGPAAPSDPYAPMPGGMRKSKDQPAGHAMGGGGREYADIDGRATREGRPEGQPAQPNDQHMPTLGYDRGRIADMAGRKLDAGRQVKRTAELSLEIDKLEERSDAAETLVKQAGGYVAGSELTTGEDDTRQSKMELKVPVDKFDDTLKALGKLGKIKGRNVSSEDLTLQISDDKEAERTLTNDLDDARSRLAQARDKRHQRDEEKAIRDIKIEIAQTQARLELMKRETRMSTISLELHERPRNAPQPAPTSFSDELRNTANSAGEAFIAAAKLPVHGLIWLLAYAPVWIPMAFAYRYAYRAQKRRTAAKETRDWQARRTQTATPEPSAP